MHTHRLLTEIEIDATPERVWQVLTDFAAYPAWNPFIRSLQGEPRPGARLAVRIQPDGGRAMRFRPTVLAADAGRELRWLGRLWLPGVFDGEHRFAIEPLANGRVRFRQEERFAGLLVPLFRSALERDTRAGFVAMNQTLKARAEAGQA